MTTPQRYSEPDETRSYMRRDGLGPWIRFTDHEADKARAVAELQKRIKFIEGRDAETLQACQQWIASYNVVFSRAEIAESTIATQQATIARLTKELEALKPTP